LNPAPNIDQRHQGLGDQDINKLIIVSTYIRILSHRTH
jgi:hypothetical protein